MRRASRDLVLSVAVFLLARPIATSGQNTPDRVAPVAEAGLSRYAGNEPIRLDGTGSYDPDQSGPLHYAWAQVSGPVLTLTDAETATPLIDGFVQTEAIQECEFQLVVDDGAMTSLPDTVKIFIVPHFIEDPMTLHNSSFDPQKPTLIYFGGGDCTYGTAEYAECPVASPEWLRNANVLSFPQGYRPDANTEGAPTYYHLADQVIVYLSSAAADFDRAIQTVGWSTGTQPAIDVGLRLNRVYQDARYAVNHVTHLDATCRTLADWGGNPQRYNQDIDAFRDSAVSGEPCWVDHYWGRLLQSQTPQANLLAVHLGNFEHQSVRDWYGQSLTIAGAGRFNDGIVAGAYWSVIGPGRNLQPAPEEARLFFRWNGDLRRGQMVFANEAVWPGTLPEPVTLIGPVRIGQTNNIILTCKESHNAVGYQFLVGSDPARVMDFEVISDTPGPPQIDLSDLPPDAPWWTVRVYDRFGSTIHADPVRVAEIGSLSFRVRNVTRAREYASLRAAIEDADSHNEIVAQEGVYEEHVDFMGKSITVRSSDPNDPAVVAGTILTAPDGPNAVTLSSGNEADSALCGFTITRAETAILCKASRARVVRCRIVGNRGFGVELSEGSSPLISHCVIAANGDAAIAVPGRSGSRLYLHSRPVIENCTIACNAGPGFAGGTAIIRNSIVYFNGGGIASDSATVAYSDIEGGWQGQGNIDADPLFASPENGDYHLKSEAGRWDAGSRRWVRDDVTSPCIDAGDPNAEFGEEVWPHGRRINMGVHGGTRQASMSSAPVPFSLPRITYIYWWDRDKAESFQSFLTAHGCPVTLVQSSQIGASLDDCNLFIIGSDTQNAPAWTDGRSIDILNGLGKPVVGLGEGGYRFFGKMGLRIGYPNGTRTSRDSVYVVDPDALLLSTPYRVSVSEDRLLRLYTQTDHVTIYLWPVPQTVIAFAREADTAGYYPVVAENGRYLLWGFTEPPDKMTPTGRNLFLNAVILTANAALAEQARR
ncbi:MAG TPA: right-handed parallel beta-helix repeat-containing protein [Sedimentisphaerales bacterium]|nr:right-handed parallel beta-helix repeat-containing protein [Sedimentisphaerales bacterium]HRS11431.1 right-handed parallel beta-helix repeat-containing protein [Sedimentisphaerales bacterium]HRV48031.1 right-handed parallel beta-helix repeat-containing protein [Sedimentisphaerales bacterium]